MEKTKKQYIGPEAGAAKIPVQRLVVQNKILVGDVVEPLKLSDDEIKELVTKVSEVMEKRIVADAWRILSFSARSAA